MPVLQVPVPGLRILVVDDDPVLRASLGNTLRDEGHQVTLAGGGQEGIDLFRVTQQSAVPFDVVLTDLGMPYVDGRQVAATVRTIAPDTPIILLTGWGQQMGPENDVPQVNRVLGKPPRLRELRAALAELTTARGAD
jgi:CheY-like chemotaxis protein